MIVIPAIDIKDGKCVRLVQGDFNKVTVYSENPVEQARKFENAGAKLIHIVDLDGAYQGKPVNDDIVAEIAASVTIPVEIGGGIRNAENIKKYVEKGINRVIIGTAALDDRFISDISDFTENIIIGVDAKDGKVATHGWVNVSDVDAIEFIGKLKNSGFSEIIYTDIATDGMLQGPNIPAMLKVLENVPGIRLIASGGVSELEDLKKLSVLSGRGIKGVIVGKAIYDGRISLTEAMSIC
ncbi:MAG: 1-(5-phosphoribosyl)-5-[(5-phosphoribosylamino)methylideneamino]imidazole-4-carboxamide isomerase [Spirochaetes bacterium]|nr:1-(5-phosphoribosyl)-5-[(5-phosphoribosylamino)methylideneamino]imidazole-4-carboxamide isomerase [Spirochaetota bacterium]